MAQYNTTSKEVLDLKSENKRLEEENAGWELLMRDQTMSGSVRGRGMFSEDWLDEGMSDDDEPGAQPADGKAQEVAKGKVPAKRRPTVLESLDEEMEMGLENEGVQGETMASMGSGGDLAAELGRADGAEVGDAGTVKPSEADGESSSLSDTPLAGEVSMPGYTASGKG